MTNMLMALLLDDQQEPRESMREVLQLHEISVVTATNIESALKEFTNNHAINIVITDINLRNNSSDQSGLTFAALIRAIKPSIPIAAYSAQISAADIDPESFRAFDAYLNKSNSNVGKIESFVEKCAALARTHRDTVTLATKQGMSIFDISKSDANLATPDLAELDSRYIKKPTMTQLITIIGLIGALASIAGLYYTIR